MPDDVSAEVRWSPLLRRWAGWVARGLTIAILSGIILRLTLRDGVPLLATLYYALPLPVIVCLTAARLGCAWAFRQHRLAIFWGLVLIGTALTTTFSMGQWHESIEAADTIRVVCWNTGRGRAGWEPAFAETINRLQPDIVGLIEAGGDWETKRQFWEQHCPGFQAVPIGGALLCLTRGEAGEGNYFALADGGRCGQLTVAFDGLQIAVLLVDVDANPLRFRARPLQALAEHAERLSDRPVVILGDFNTPSDSVHFSQLREHHRHAFDSAGRGYAGTWPLPLPVHNLDQVWTNERLRPVACHHEWTSLSDHRLVVADIVIVPAAQSARREDSLRPDTPR